MEPESILSFIRDVLVVGYMFILRIGVPILITLMIGAWLRRLLEEKPHAQRVTPAAGSSQHCWDLAQTDETREIRAVASARPDLPCWLALQVAGPGLKRICYNCAAFQGRAPAPVRAR